MCFSSWSSAVIGTAGRRRQGHAGRHGVSFAGVLASPLPLCSTHAVRGQPRKQHPKWRALVGLLRFAEPANALIGASRDPRETESVTYCIRKNLKLQARPHPHSAGPSGKATDPPGYIRAVRRPGGGTEQPRDATDPSGQTRPEMPQAHPEIPQTRPETPQTRPGPVRRCHRPIRSFHRPVRTCHKPIRTCLRSVPDMSQTRPDMPQTRPGHVTDPPGHATDSV